MGRLIDADKLEYTCNSDECGMLTGCNHCQYNIITEDEIDSAPTVEAIPKDQYENRLKADMVAMLTDLQLEIEELIDRGDCNDQRWGYWLCKNDCRDLIQEKINKLKENTENV